MNINRKIYIDNFDYDLPDNRIARYPLPERDASGLLIYHGGNIRSDSFNNLPLHIEAGSLMVFNDTRVIPARLLFNKPTGAIIEIFCLEPAQPSDYQLSLGAKEKCTWNCIIGNLKRWKSNKLEKLIVTNNKTFLLKAEKLSSGHTCEIGFSWNDPGMSFASVIQAAGEMPVPPYLRRDPEIIDRSRYQTIYSKPEGSVAAPTAGLHFTQRILDKLSEAGTKCCNVTLHVGAGTFIPVKTPAIDDHLMHTEHFFVSRETVSRLINHSGKIIAVGTTTVRTLESLYWIGVKLISKPMNTAISIQQWEAYDLPQNIEPANALRTIFEYLSQNGSDELMASTQLLIIPGYRFRMADAMITNFHQPKSTLLLLVAAYIGNNWKKIYNFALENGYRFLSYGDCSLLFYDR